MAEMMVGVNEKVAAELGKVAAGRSSQAVEEARKMAKELAEETGLNEQELFKGALWLSQFVGEFRGLDVELDPERLKDCPVCRDTGFQVEEGEADKPSSARACPACDVGLSIEAGDWLNAVRPLDARSGKRYDSFKGEKAFTQAFRHLPARKVKVQQRMNELEHRQSGRKGKKDETGGTWE
jgi:hypothetical protein